MTGVGSGNMGMSLAALLAQEKEIALLDIDAECVEQTSSGKFTLADPEIEVFFTNSSSRFLRPTQKSGI